MRKVNFDGGVVDAEEQSDSREAVEARILDIIATAVRVEKRPRLDETCTELQCTSKITIQTGCFKRRNMH